MARKRRAYPAGPEGIAAERAVREPELARQIAKAERILKKHGRRLLARKGVTGIDVGLKRKEGQYVRPLQYVIRVHVDVKLGQDQLSARSRLPKSIGGVGIDVLERRYLSGAAPPLKEEWKKVHDPIPGGCAISCDQGQTVGTLGMKVLVNGQPHYLTNAHVALRKGNPVWQPPLTGPGVPTGAARIIGEVVVPLVKNLTVDCALIKPSGARPPSGTILGIPAGTAFSVRRLQKKDEGATQLFKMGATTGSDPTLLGVVDNVEAKTGDPSERMTRQITVTMGSTGVFCGEGDSGAILLGRNAAGGFEIVGLVHGATFDSQTAVACHFDAVMKALKFTL